MIKCSGGGGTTNSCRGMRAWKNSTETQQLGQAPRFGPEVKNGRSSVKDGVLERLRCDDQMIAFEVCK